LGLERVSGKVLVMVGHRVSAGVKGLRTSVNSRGARVTGSIPGTGARYQKKITKGSGRIASIIITTLSIVALAHFF